MDHYYFDGILDEIKDKINPEVTHFRKGNHPGPKWYLKTVCPTPNLKQIDKFGYGLLWANLAQQYPDKIKVVPHAYDWTGTEIPYMVNKSQLIEQIAETVKDKKVEGISDLRDESDRTGMRIVLELKRNANPEVVQNMLFKYTRLASYTVAFTV